MVKYPNTELTGWILSDAIIAQSCPKCKSDKGYYCQTPKGKKAKTHTDRVAIFIKSGIISSIN